MDRFFGLDTPAPTEEGLSLVASLFNPVSLSIAEELLREGGVRYLKKERGSGEVVRVISGFQIFGTDLFVSEEDAARAAELLLPLTEEADETDAGAETEEEEI